MALTNNSCYMIKKNHYAIQHLLKIAPSLINQKTHYQAKLTIFAPC